MKPLQVAAGLLLSAITGCTTAQEIRFPDGTIDYLITCAADLGWNICYDKANAVCPSGYTTIFEDPGFFKSERVAYRLSRCQKSL